MCHLVTKNINLITKGIIIMLKEQIAQYLDMLECEYDAMGNQSAEKRFVKALLASYIDDLKEIISKEQTQ